MSKQENAEKARKATRGLKGYDTATLSALLKEILARLDALEAAGVKEGEG